MGLVMEVKAFPFLPAVSAKQRTVQVEKNMFQTLYGIDDIPEAFVNAVKLYEVSSFIRLKNLDSVDCDASALFSKTILKTGSEVSSSAQSSVKYAEII